jgi:hypothetical protein
VTKIYFLSCNHKNSSAISGPIFPTRRKIAAENKGQRSL